MTAVCWRGECRDGCYYADVCSLDTEPDYAPQECAHEWLDRPESDTFECLLCGTEGSGFAPGGGPWQAEFHRAEDAEERGEGICRTCLAPIWNKGGTVGNRKRDEGWSDRIERGGDSLVCFKAVQYRHVPLIGREAAIYDRAYLRGTGGAA